MFAPERLNFSTITVTGGSGGDGLEASVSPSAQTNLRSEQVGGEENPEPVAANSAQPIFTEQQALEELPAIPIYFASSYALVKPYVAGFDANLLDAPSLQHIRIETNWQPPKSDTSIRVVSNR